MHGMNIKFVQRKIKLRISYIWISEMLNVHGSNHHLSNELFGDQIQPVGDLLLSELQELQVEDNKNQ